jgi:hypothetical protein
LPISIQSVYSFQIIVPVVQRIEQGFPKERKDLRRYLHQQPRNHRVGKHDFLVALLKESRYGMTHFMFKQGAVLTLFFGWIISSKEARQFIAQARQLRMILACGIVLYSLLFIFWAWTFRRRSQSAYTHLLRLRFMPADFYATLLLTRAAAVSLVSIHVVGSAVLIACLFKIH